MQVFPSKSEAEQTTNATPTAAQEQKTARATDPPLPKISATDKTTAASTNSTTADEKTSAEPAAANTGVANSSEPETEGL